MDILVKGLNKLAVLITYVMYSTHIMNILGDRPANCLGYIFLVQLYYSFRGKDTIGTKNTHRLDCSLNSAAPIHVNTLWKQAVCPPKANAKTVMMSYRYIKQRSLHTFQGPLHKYLINCRSSYQHKRHSSEILEAIQSQKIFWGYPVLLQGLIYEHR